MALRNDADAICEKPLVLNPWNLDALEEIECETGRKIFTILQLRLHPAIRALKKEMDDDPGGSKKREVELTYITSRGRWYFISWKGNTQKSGGVATNIGIHFFDMLGWIFGECKGIEVEHNLPEKARGRLYFEKATVKWFLSVDETDLPAEAIASGKRTFRKINIEEREFEFSEGFTDLHTKSYEEILLGNGFGIRDARQSIEIASKIRSLSLDHS
jgi:UDP-N-acetyl-2-amino-2-deoxyglucuronate dehydrogenase